MSVYSPLEYRLAQADQNALTLSFSEIETVLGRKLPRSAYDDRIKRQWWANTDTHVQAKAWLKAGRRARLDADRNQVTFLRDEDQSGLATVTIALDQLSPVARLALEQLQSAAGGDMGRAVVQMLNEAASDRRRAAFARMDQLNRGIPKAEVSSVDLIREDRDAR